MKSSRRININKILSNENFRIVLTSTIILLPKQFEKLYLRLKSDIKGDLQKTFANPILIVHKVMGGSRQRYRE